VSKLDSCLTELLTFPEQSRAFSYEQVTFEVLINDKFPPLTQQAMPRKLESKLKYECNKAQFNCYQTRVQTYL